MIKIGDLVRCKICGELGLGIVLEIKSFPSTTNVMCHWLIPDKKFTYLLDQLEIVEELCSK